MKLTANPRVAEFRQDRADMNPEMSLGEYLTGSGVNRRDRPDQLDVRGKPRNVIAYLKDYQFTKHHVRAPIKSLSGGETARLALAKVMAGNCDLLALDEPTNDLDVESLDLLQEVVSNWTGTVLIVSHDRDFIDRVATLTVASNGDGTWTTYAGGWSDYQSQSRGKKSVRRNSLVNKKPKAIKRRVGKKSKRPGLTFTEEHRSIELLVFMGETAERIDQYTREISDPALAEKNPRKFRETSVMLAEAQAALQSAEDEWLFMELRAEAE